jgi:hypothetical protein
LAGVESLPEREAELLLGFDSAAEPPPAED